MTAYATNEQALLTFQQPPSHEDRLARLEFLLGVASRQLDQAALRDWLRHPAWDDREEGEPDPETWYASGAGRRTLCAHEGIVRLDELHIRYSDSLAYEDVAAGGWELRGSDPRSDEPTPADSPSFHVVLMSSAAGYFPRGVRAVKLVGVRGWDTPPVQIIEATIERARQLYSADSSFSGAPVGSLDMGTPATSLPSLPSSFWEFLRAERQRFWCHV